MTSPEPTPQSTGKRRGHARIRVVPLRPVRYPLKVTLMLADFGPVYRAAAARDVTPSEFMRQAVMRAAQRELTRRRPA